MNSKQNNLLIFYDEVNLKCLKNDKIPRKEIFSDLFY
ncbi:hypothetical protein LCGC14_1124520 [marine sediment metagenome]|uniref:Uncharacterized protein n=1 Tax=marine sediment metagenome TaxID=412755 RepID=A0A0F9M306_9ZZZZ